MRKIFKIAASALLATSMLSGYARAGSWVDTPPAPIDNSVCPSSADLVLARAKEYYAEANSNKGLLKGQWSIEKIVTLGRNQWPGQWGDTIACSAVIVVSPPEGIPASEGVNVNPFRAVTHFAIYVGPHDETMDRVVGGHKIQFENLPVYVQDPTAQQIEEQRALKEQAEKVTAEHKAAEEANRLAGEQALDEILQKAHPELPPGAKFQVCDGHNVCRWITKKGLEQQVPTRVKPPLSSLSDGAKEAPLKIVIVVSGLILMHPVQGRRRHKLESICQNPLAQMTRTKLIIHNRWML